MGLKNTGRRCEPISFAAHHDDEMFDCTNERRRKERLQRLQADDVVRHFIKNSNFDFSYSDYLKTKKMRSDVNNF